MQDRPKSSLAQTVHGCLKRDFGVTTHRLKNTDLGKDYKLEVYFSFLSRLPSHPRKQKCFPKIKFPLTPVGNMCSTSTKRQRQPVLELQKRHCPCSRISRRLKGRGSFIPAHQIDGLAWNQPQWPTRWMTAIKLSYPQVRARFALHITQLFLAQAQSSEADTGTSSDEVTTSFRACDNCFTWRWNSTYWGKYWSCHIFTELP